MIECKKQDYKLEMGKLSLSEKKNRLEEFIVRYTYDSSKLAGVNVSLRQTYLILREGIIPRGFKNLKTVKELENHEKAVMVITKYKGILNIKFLERIHKTLLCGVDD